MMSGAGSSPQLAKAKLSLNKNPAEALIIAEQILNGDPGSSAALRVVVDAAVALELPQTATFALETMVKNSPKDKALVIEYSERLAQSGGDTQNGERALQDLIRASGYDGDLNQALKNLSARTTMDQGGYNASGDGKSSFRDMLKNKDEAVKLEQSNRVVKTEMSPTGSSRNTNSAFIPNRTILKSSANSPSSIRKKTISPRRWPSTTRSGIRMPAAIRRWTAPLRKPRYASSIFRFHNSIRSRPTWWNRPRKFRRTN